VLPGRTEKLLRAIDGAPSAGDLLLVGGTALALRIAHRRSADLDFAFPAQRLPRRKVDNLLDELRSAHEVTPMANVAAEQDFLNSGLELADCQRDYSIDGVKVTFFTPDPSILGQALRGEAGLHGLKQIRVADLDSLFLMKAVTLNSRVTTRDLFDVYTLIRGHGYREADVFRFAQQFDFSPDTLKARLRHARSRIDDPGIELPDGVPPTFEQLQAYFIEAINRVEQDAASQAMRERAQRSAASGPTESKSRTSGKRHTARKKTR
jgi:hypothetical protein